MSETPTQRAMMLMINELPQFCDAVQQAGMPLNVYSLRRTVEEVTNHSARDEDGNLYDAPTLRNRMLTLAAIALLEVAALDETL